MKAITVVLVEPQAIFLHGVEKDLEAAPDIKVVRTTTDGADGISLVRELSPNVAVIALQEDFDGVNLLNELKDVFGTKILVLTAEEREETILECMLLGAQGYLFKWGINDDLADSIRRVHQGEIVMCPQSLRVFIRAVRKNQSARVDAPTKDADQLLTPREREVIQMVGVGKSNAQIADDLHLSVATIKTHRRNSYSKLKVHRSAAAVQRALELGLIDRRRNGGD